MGALRRHFGPSLAATLALLGLLLPRIGRADGASGPSRADELFRQGKAMLSQRNYGEACPLLAASFELEPGTGVLLALAICHEGEGKLASASAKYEEVAARAEREGRADRERVARERAASLKPRLSTLTLVPPANARATSDFVIRRSGVVLERTSWETAVPLDGGEYIVEATASGKKPWRSAVALAPAGDRKLVTIPELEDDARLPATAVMPPIRHFAPPETGSSAPGTATSRAPAGDARAPDAAGRGLSPLQVAGVVGIGAGAVGLGLGTFYAFRAMKKFDDSNQNGCDGDVCEGQGKTDRLDARSSGTAATVGFVVGTTLVAGGIAALVFGARSEDSHSSSLRPVSGSVSLERGGMMLTVDGRL